jgi:hypothetical protein
MTFEISRIHAVLILRSGVSRISKDGPRASWFETREDALLTMRNDYLSSHTSSYRT